MSNVLNKIDKYLGEGNTVKTGDYIEVLKSNQKYQGMKGKVVKTSPTAKSNDNFKITVNIEGNKVVMMNHEVKKVKPYTKM